MFSIRSYAFLNNMLLVTVNFHKNHWVMSSDSLSVIILKLYI